jgi:hypothetical protein
MPVVVGSLISSPSHALDSSRNYTEGVEAPCDLWPLWARKLLFSNEYCT